MHAIQLTLAKMMEFASTSLKDIMEINSLACVPMVFINNYKAYKALNKFALGFSGDLCATKIKECDQNPCLHGGQCSNRTGEVRCECPKGYQGKTCETKVNQNFFMMIKKFHLHLTL